ncbi:hypothetical protein [Motilimonas pumila]|uniref:Glycine zipper domain-containing protein n=1 Tax=Motilimonas pumila TaxID=2303987 RepID=A0A418YIN3_9GAMM|nr:hypothetical protein [Motilimonas pumila]RJG50505.1 hypothetical protein D1Z90_03220 [Motilimonas pumila]
MNTKQFLLLAVFGNAAMIPAAIASYDDHCDNTFGHVVEGTVTGSLVGGGVGVIADGHEGAKRGAAVGAIAGAVDGLVEGEVRRERCRRDMRDLEDAIIEQAAEDIAVEDIIINDAIDVADLENMAVEAAEVDTEFSMGDDGFGADDDDFF